MKDEIKLNDKMNNRNPKRGVLYIAYIKKKLSNQCSSVEMFQNQFLVQKKLFSLSGSFIYTCIKNS